MQENINLTKVNSVYHSVKELYLSYCEELDREKKSLEQIANDMKEAQDYLSYLSSHQNSDAFVFSPRGVISKNSASAQESVYDTGKVIDFSDTQKKKDELASLESNKRISEEKIKKLDSTIAILESNKDILKEVASSNDALEEERKNLQEKSNQALKEYEQKCEELRVKLKEGSLDKLSYLSHMTEMVSSYIDSDPMRAKLELKKMKEDILSVVKDLEQLV
ncbi:MAG: hypothetical protein IJZ42_10055 [Lachnospiraceae bacterium]|nr:hypothetical protein [Lachnospiraceae bacterium]